MIESTSRRRQNFAAFFFFWLVFAVSLLSYRGIAQSDDEQLFIAVAQNLAFHGGFSAEQLSGNSRLAGVYNGEGLAHVALGAVLIRLIDQTRIGFVEGLLWLPVLYFALTGALLLVYVRESGYPLRSAVIAAAVYCFSSIGWVYGQGFFRETLAGLFVVAGLFFGRRAMAARPGPRHFAFAAAFLLSLAGMVLTKAVLILVVPAILLVITDGRSVEIIDRRKNTAAVVIGAAVIAGAFLLARAAIPAEIPTRYDFPRSIPATIELIFSQPQDRFFANLLAPIISPGRGLLFFSPLLLAGLISWPFVRPESRRISYAALWSVGVIVVLEAATIGNEGWSLSWGPRRLLPVLPLLLIAALPVYEKLSTSKSAWIRSTFYFSFAVCIAIQLGGVLVSRGQARTALDAEIGDFYSDELVWSPRYSPVIYSWKILLMDGTVPDLAVAQRSGSPEREFGERFRAAAAYLDANASENDALIIDHYLSDPWLFFFDHNGSGHFAFLSLPIPGERWKPRQTADYRAAIAELAGRDSIWMVSENPEFQLSEGYEHVAEFLDGYELVLVEGFTDSPVEPSLIVFRWEK